MGKMWDGRFSVSTNQLMEAFNSSIQVDKRLVFKDIEGSMAHVKMLHQIEILTGDEKNLLLEGLEDVATDFVNDDVLLTDALEDIHMAVEHYLTEKIGETGKKLHTGRSRNDQVALDMRLYTKDAIQEIQEKLLSLIQVLIHQSDAFIDCIMPGFTHLQKAQPIRLSYHLMAYVEMFKRDYTRLSDAYNRMDELPLGVGAFAGVNYDNDRNYLKELLGFDRVGANGMDLVSDRDYLVESMSANALIMTHLSRFAEELIIWSSNDYNYISMSDSFSTGSSIMPQKKNPDAAELIRGKSGRVTGQLVTILTIMKALPLAYNKDMQEDKECFFDSLDTVLMCLEVMTEMIKTITYNKGVMLKATEDGYLNATDLADYLVSKGTPFREAHKKVGLLVKEAVESHVSLNNLSGEAYLKQGIELTDALRLVLSIEQCVESKKSYGGTSKKSVLTMIDDNKNWIEKKLINS